jgi:hypothetical protein
MQTFIMLTRLSHSALQSPSSLENLEREVMERIEAECPEVYLHGAGQRNCHESGDRGANFRSC